MKKLGAILGFYFLLTSQSLAGVPCSLPFTLTNGTTADATQVMANYNALVTCLTQAASAGANNDITSLTGLITPITPPAGGSSVFIGGTSSGPANAQIIFSTLPTGFALNSGYTVIFIAGAANTGPMTLNVNGQGVINVFRMSPSGPQALTGGEISTAGSLVEVVYDGTQFELMSVQAQFGGYGPLTSIVSATSTDLGTVPSHNAKITGTTTITSFGTTASVTFPMYRLTFAGSLTITYNQTNCATTGGCILTPGGGNIVTQANDTAQLMYLGAGSGGGGNWQVLNYQPANGTAVVNPTPLCGAVGLNITNNAGTPNTEVNLAADSAVLINPTGNAPIYVTGVSVVINDTTNGANGLDAGSLANNTFYHHYLISNGTTTAGLDSLSATAPTMPSGYTYRCRLGASKTNGSASFYAFLTTGATTQYVVGGANLSATPVIQNGTVGSNCISGTISWHADTVVGASGTAPIWYPPTATDIAVIGTGSLAVAPNASYTNPSGANGAPLIAGASNISSITLWMKLEATTIQDCGVSAAYALYAFAWKDKVNAN